MGRGERANWASGVNVFWLVGKPTRSVSLRGAEATRQSILMSAPLPNPLPKGARGFACCRSFGVTWVERPCTSPRPGNTSGL